MYIGLIAGSFKPFTKGHHFLIEKASKENDMVIIYVSTLDRKRKNEFPIEWKKMNQIWSKYLFDIIPNNAKVIFVSNPITSIYNFLHSKENSNDKFIIYGDKNDIKNNFPEKRLKRNNPILCKKNKIYTKLFIRKNNINISGTKMRMNISNNDLLNFSKGLPKPIQRYAKDIFNILT